jgi:hypothetical protein
VACGVIEPVLEQHFDLQHPPEGWYRFVDPVLGYAIWIPDDWLPKVIKDAPDVTFLASYHHLDETKGGVLIDWIEPVDFQTDHRDPMVWQERAGDVFPESTYILKIDNFLIPCARYYRGVSISNRVNHVCVVASSRVKYYEIRLTTRQDWEEKLQPTWQLIVAGFVLEQPPNP